MINDSTIENDMISSSKNIFRKTSLWIGITIGYFLVYWFIYAGLAFTEVCNDWLCKCWWIMGRTSFCCALLLLFRLNIARFLAIVLLFIKLTAGTVINIYIVYTSGNLFILPLCGIAFIIRFVILEFLLKPETRQWFCLEEKILRWIRR